MQCQSSIGLLPPQLYGTVKKPRCRKACKDRNELFEESITPQSLHETTREWVIGSHIELQRERSLLEHQSNGSLRSDGETAIRMSNDQQTEKETRKRSFKSCNFQGASKRWEREMFGEVAARPVSICESQLLMQHRWTFVKCSNPEAGWGTVTS